jgi:chemotaxis protein histidine kinase CheA
MKKTLLLLLIYSISFGDIFDDTPTKSQNKLDLFDDTQQSSHIDGLETIQKYRVKKAKDEVKQKLKKRNTELESRCECILKDCPTFINFLKVGPSYPINASYEEREAIDREHELREKEREEKRKEEIRLAYMSREKLKPICFAWRDGIDIDTNSIKQKIKALDNEIAKENRYIAKERKKREKELNKNIAHHKKVAKEKIANKIAKQKRIEEEKKQKRLEQIAKQKREAEEIKQRQKAWCYEEPNRKTLCQCIKYFYPNAKTCTK